MEYLKKVLYDFIDYAYGSELDRVDFKIVADVYVEQKQKEDKNENNKV